MDEKSMTLEIANSFPLWLVCGLVIGVLIFQVVIFYLIGRQHMGVFGISKKEMHDAVRSGAITSIGAALSKFIIGLSLIASIGTPMVMIHANVAGNTQYEVSSAQLAASAAGSALGAENFSPQALTNVVWVMNLGCICMMILPLIAIKPLTSLRDITMKKSKVGMVIGVSASIASFAYMSYGYAAQGSYSLVATLIGFFVMLGLSILAKKKKLAAIRDWSYVISMLCAFIAVAIFY